MSLCFFSLFMTLRVENVKWSSIEDTHLLRVGCIKKKKRSFRTLTYQHRQTHRQSHRSMENVTSWCILPNSSLESISDVWSLGITFTQQINGGHALEPFFENLKQFSRTFTLAPTVCLSQNMGGNVKSIVLIYLCQNDLTYPKYQKWPTEF